MATYTKREISQDSRGVFFRFLGRDEHGAQVKFYLGRDEDSSRLAASKLKIFWQRLNRLSPATTWTSTTLPIAKAISRGDREIAVPGTGQKVNTLADFARDLIQVIPSDPDTYAKTLRSVQERHEAAGRLLTPISHAGTLHEALDAYRAYLVEQAAHGDESGWIHTQQGEARRLLRHPDCPLAHLTLAKMEEMLTYWARRPKVAQKGHDNPISPLTARNMMKRLRDFWRWLHRSDKFSWKRPDGWDEIRVRISKRAEDHRRALQVKTYTPEQLTILYCHASRLVRSFILLGLNCGFKPAEIATLTKDEIRGDTIKRVRIKSGVYGEWKMWPETLEAVKWAMGRSDGQLVFLTSTGNPYNSKTATGSKPNKIPSLWNNLYRTISKREGEFPKLPISALRDTAANWMRANHGGEITGIYLAHGQPVRTDALADVYSNRPFHLVHDALTAYRKHLQDMFKGA